MTMLGSAAHRKWGDVNWACAYVVFYQVELKLLS